MRSRRTSVRPEARARHADGHAGEIRDGVGARHGVRQHAPHLRRRELPLRDPRDDEEVPRRIEAHRLDAILQRDARDEPAEQRRRDVVRVALDPRREPQDGRVRAVAPASPPAATSPATVAAALEPSPRSSGIGFDMRIRQPTRLEALEAELAEPGLERDDEPVRAVLRQLADAVALDRQVDRCRVGRAAPSPRP